MKRNMRCAMIAALLMVTSMAWGYNVTIVDGITNGTITASSSTANATVTITLTVTPSDGYYITANDITITQTGGGGMAQTRTEPDIATTFHPVAGTIDAEGKGTYTFTMPVSNVKIEATFTARTVISEATVNLSTTSFTFNGSVQKPTVTSVTKDATTYLASGSTNGFADYDVSIPNSINATESPFTVSVTFCGKYTGTATANYNINQASINDVTIDAISDQTYSGSVIEPTPAVKLGDYTLIAGTDFNYSYTTDHTNVGPKTVTVTGLNGNFDTASKTADYNITVKAITNVNIAAISDQTYTGSPLMPEPVVTDLDISTTPLVKGTDYTVAYSTNNTDVTDAVTVTITGKGNYDSNTTATTTFKIVAATLDATALNDKITLSATTFPYDGSAHTPTVTITGLTEDTDFTVKYKKGTDAATTTIPTDAGTYTIVISGMGNYTGEAVTNKSFEITKVASSVTTAPTAIEDLVYNGSNQALINNDGVAANGTLHYSLDGTSYSTTIPTGKDAKAYTVYYKVVGDENHADTDPVTIPVSIAKKDITISGIKAKNKEYDGGTTATLDYTSVVFTGIEDGDALTVSTTGTFEDASLGEGKTVTLGTLTLGGTSVSNYQLATTGQQTSTTANITQAVLKAETLNSKITLSSTSIGYTGEPVAPTVTIDGMTEGTDYDVKYKNGDAEATTTKPTNNGTYTIVIVGKGNYAGEVVTSKTFQITKAAAAVATAPTAKTGLVYNGELQELITAGSGTNGTMQYSLDNKTYSTAIPKGKDAGTYTIYYKVVGNANFADTEAKTLTVTIAEPKPKIVDQSKPVAFEGETYYELLSDVVDAIDDNIKLTIALPASADSRTTVSSGALVFSKGSDINIIIRNVQKYYLLRFDFAGRILCNGSLLWRVARTRGGVDEELLSDEDYEVRVTGDMMFTLKLADKEAVLWSITLKSPPPTAIEAIEGDEGTDRWYDLNGRQISKPTRKGIYIRNGKKVVR